MKIRCVSDLHLEHCWDQFSSPESAARQAGKIIPPLSSDSSSVLLIAGDLVTVGRVVRAINLLSALIPRFRHVIWVLGNHEHYGSCITQTQQVIERALASAGLDMSGITVAGNDVVEKNIDGQVFLCTTLWTDFALEDPNYNKLLVKNAVNDYRMIAAASDGRRITPNDIEQLHRRAREQLDRALALNPGSIVVTHHLPSWSAVDAQWTATRELRAVSSAFASDLDSLIMAGCPCAWFFGHTHTPYQGQIANTRLVCNPLGYPKEQNLELAKFNPVQVHEL